MQSKSWCILRKHATKHLGETVGLPLSRYHNERLALLLIENAIDFMVTGSI